MILELRILKELQVCFVELRILKDLGARKWILRANGARSRRVLEGLRRRDFRHPDKVGAGGDGTAGLGPFEAPLVPPVEAQGKQGKQGKRVGFGRSRLMITEGYSPRQGIS